MIWLVLGVVIWSGVHFIPSIGRPLRTRLIAALGEAGYKAGFSLAIVASIVLMVVGWRSTDPVALYAPPVWAELVTFVAMIVAFVLFGASHAKTRIKRFVRHPQLTGLIVWAAAHLISNGDTRAIVLFGGLGLWALIEIPLINRREGEWVKPDAPSMGVELKGLAISLAILAVAVVLHPYYTGVSPIPR